MRASVIRMILKTIFRTIALSVYILFTALFFMQPVTDQVDNSSSMNKSPEKRVSQMKERLRLTEEQATKICPIIEESFTERDEILNNSIGDGKAIKSDLQHV